MRARRFAGRIVGVGTTAGPRLVVGAWDSSPFGAFADVMLEHDGVRHLLAPAHVASFVAETYAFDVVRRVPVSVTSCAATSHGRRGGVTRRLRVRANGLELEVVIGRRTALGTLLRLVPRAVATHVCWSRTIARLAGLVMPGVRTWGSAGGGRLEAYGAWDHHRVLALRGAWEGRDMGSLAPLDPPVRFGFSSSPRTPSLTSLTTTVIGD